MTDGARMPKGQASNRWGAFAVRHLGRWVPKRASILQGLICALTLGAGCGLPPTSPGHRENQSEEGWEVVLRSPIRILLNRHPERGFVGTDLARSFLGPDAKLTAVLHFEKADEAPPALFEKYDGFEIELSSLEGPYQVSSFGLKAGSVMRYISDRVIPDGLEVTVQSIIGVRKDRAKEKVYPK